MTLEQAKKLAAALLRGRTKDKEQITYLAHALHLKQRMPFDKAHLDAASYQGASREPAAGVIALAAKAFEFRHRKPVIDEKSVSWMADRLKGCKLRAGEVHLYAHCKYATPSDANRLGAVLRRLGYETTLEGNSHLYHL